MKEEERNCILNHPQFKNLLDQIKSHLLEKNGIEVEETFIVLMIKLVTLDPGSNFSLQAPIQDADSDRMKKLVVERIRKMLPISMDTLKMQFYYKENYFSKEELSKAQEEFLEQNLQFYLQDLILNVPKVRKHFEIYYQKFLAATILKANLGSPKDSSVVKLTKMALNSVFPMEDISLLIPLTVAARENEIRQIMKMVKGIRLYNKETSPKDMGAGIEDIPTILLDKIFWCKQVLNSTKEVNLNRLNHYLKLAKSHLFLDKGQFKNYNEQMKNFENNLILLRQAVIMIHQFLAYNRELESNLLPEEERGTFLKDNFYKILTELKSIIKNQEQESLPTYIVYPKFIELAQVYKNIEESKEYLELVIKLIEKMQEFCEKHLQKMDELILESMKKENVKSQENVATNANAINKKANLPDLDIISSEYSGYCVVSFVRGGGLLETTTDRELFYKFNNKIFLFSSLNALIDFKTEPEKYLKKALVIIRYWPELINILNMEKDAFNPALTFGQNELGSILTSKRSIETQTEIHPIESNIVKNYSWNEWELRRNALKLNKIVKCKTSSTQTNIQALKKPVSIQTYPLKNRAIQTDRENDTFIPKSNFYFFGLRGINSVPHIVELNAGVSDYSKCRVPTCK